MKPDRLGCALPLALMLGVLLALIVAAGCRPAQESEPSAPAPAVSQAPPEAAPADDALTPEDLRLDLDPNSVSASGVSSGGYMAQQLHFAYADSLVGAGIVAAGPYGCAGGSLGVAMARCMAGASQPLEAGELAEAVTAAAAAGRIADPAHLAGDRVWLFRGTLDAQIGAEVAATAAALYRKFVDPENVVFVDDFDAAHHFPTLAAGAPCDQSEPPFLGACDFDAAGAILEHIYGPLEEPAEAARDALSEVAYNPPGNAATLMERAYLYVPARCAEGAARCRLHLVLHGCLQSAETVGTAFAAGAGFNRWADTNDIVVAYPQVQSSAANPYGCWDWWGYTGAAHPYRDGPQVAALMDLVHRLTRRGGA